MEINIINLTKVILYVVCAVESFVNWGALMVFNWRQGYSWVGEALKGTTALSLYLSTFTHRLHVHKYQSFPPYISKIFFHLLFLLRLLCDPFLVIYTKSWKVDLYFAGLMARLIIPRSLINSVPCTCPILPPVTVCTLCKLFLQRLGTLSFNLPSAMNSQTTLQDTWINCCWKACSSQQEAEIPHSWWVDNLMSGWVEECFFCSQVAFEFHV